MEARLTSTGGAACVRCSAQEPQSKNQAARTPVLDP